MGAPCIWGWIVDHATILSTVVSAAAAVAVAIFTAVLVCIGRSADRNFRTVERAYVKLSHKGLGVEWFGSDPGKFIVRVRIKNFGRTPATTKQIAIDRLIFSKATDVPKVPPYTITLPTGAFLVTEDEFNHTIVLRVTPGEYADIISGTRHMLVFGYIDYADQFGVAHRAGYGRLYEALRDERDRYESDETFLSRNNLIFMDDPTAYNYDRPNPPATG